MANMVNRFAKNTTQRRRVTRERPSENRARIPTLACAGAMVSNGLSGVAPTPGATRLTISASAAPRSPRSARKRGDSGNHAIRMGTIRSGSTPPVTNTDSQPKRLMSAAAATPPAMIPRGKPTNMVVINSARRRAGANSAVKMLMVGITPPRPRPVRKRYRNSSNVLSAVAVNKANTPMTATETRITGLRPMRSATGLPTSAPAIKPTSAEA